MQIVFDEKSPAEKLQAFFTQAAELILVREGLDAAKCEISLSFVTLGEMQALNLKYRSIDTPTDVLSFPMYGSVDEIHEAFTGAGAPVLLGDVAICTEAAKRQAEGIGQTLDRELLYLFIHSVLHLLGYDHIEEAGRVRMREAEEEILSQLPEEAGRVLMREEEETLEVE